MGYKCITTSSTHYLNHFMLSSSKSLLGDSTISNFYCILVRCDLLFCVFDVAVVVVVGGGGGVISPFTECCGVLVADTANLMMVI